MTHVPKIQFLIGGVQKAGTTALASYLADLPSVALPTSKEAHVFDTGDFQEDWSVEDVDARYASEFASQWESESVLHGDATPIYLLHSRFVERIHRYNPRMRWIVLLRHPVERAISQHHMERKRGHESLPLFAALLAERWRLRGKLDDFGAESPIRRHSYRLRSDYAPQLAVLYSHFPREQVLVLRSDALLSSPHAALSRIHDFLGLEPPHQGANVSPAFVGNYPRWGPSDWRRRLLCWWWRDEIEAQEALGLDWDHP